ncbi:hypothetical protein [Piscirickettsia litoralis]|uniref:Uncharacterized protein n=1 Tax=Piscirickettsia litoralis TaxID=1891921 RepID=A0ABX3A280_9GAMM|nr:hypothetical protein [Piscirickettsia litoralis]ODN41495.1 hypothetical protein BGC07_15385 [Piscirickettsia litoralis]
MCIFLGVVELGPVVSLNPPTDRLIGILLGVSSIALFQKLFWKFGRFESVQHTINQTKLYLTLIRRSMSYHIINRKSMNYNFSMLEHSLKELNRVDLNPNNQLYAIRANIVNTYQELYYHLYCFSSMRDAVVSHDSQDVIGIYNNLSGIFALNQDSNHSLKVDLDEVKVGYLQAYHKEECTMEEYLMVCTLVRIARSIMRYQRLYLEEESKFAYYHSRFNNIN